MKIFKAFVSIKGSLKQETVSNLDKYIHRDERLPMLFKRMRDNGKKIFLLTNSDYIYTEKVMSYLFDMPLSEKCDWKSYFDYIVVDARFVSNSSEISKFLQTF